MLMSFPVELLHAVAKCISRHNYWCTLALLCKTLNDIATPLIYADITFGEGSDCAAALKCLRTLASSPRLAGLVRRLKIMAAVGHGASSLDLAMLHADFVKGLPSMLALHHLRYESHEFTPDAWAALAQVSAELESLAIGSGKMDFMYEGELPQQLAKLDIHFARLTKFAVSRDSPMPLKFALFLQKILNERAAHIKSIAFTFLWLGHLDLESNWQYPILAPGMSWASLHTHGTSTGYPSRTRSLSVV